MLVLVSTNFALNFITAHKSTNELLMFEILARVTSVSVQFKLECGDKILVKHAGV